jgi:hypothetical protein
MNSKKNNIVISFTFGILLATGFFLALFAPKEGYSYSERRKLSPLPEVSQDTLLSGRFMSDFESYTLDNFPYRDSFRSIKALASTELFHRQDNNGIYASNGYLAAMEYPLDESSLDYAAGRFRYIYDTYLTAGNHIYLSVIPDKNCFLAPLGGRLSIDYDEAEKHMAQKADFAEYITISDLLELDDYYRTDTHWRQEKITDVANRLLKGMGAAFSQDYKTETLNQDFYGVYYGQAALLFKPDTLCCLTWDSMENCRVLDWQNNRQIPVYDLDRAKGVDPYEMFLSGPLSLITIDNPKAPEEKKLVLFRDSFGSSIAPLFIGGYSQITLVDIRYIHPGVLGKFIDFTACDVLFLYSTLVLNNSTMIK